VRELEVHAALEEEIFYPAADEQIDQKETIDEAREEHHVVKLLIGELKKMSAADERYDAKYKVLSESVKHHIEEEESELFPKLEGELDAEGLGAQMETRKQELQRQSRKRSGVRGVKSRKSRAKTARKTSGAKKARRKATGGRRSTGGRR
jgi:hemerythrin-like domain-containing protein